VVVGEIIYFNASNSYDLDGVIVSYFWDFGDGSNATGITAQHAYNDSGVYVVTLIVTDDDGATGSASAQKTVEITLPVASFTESAETVYTGETITFNASGSYDPDGVIVSYFWDFGDGTNATGVVVEHSYANNSNYTVTLTVTDDDDATDSTSATKTVLNRLPVASFSESAETVYTSETISFNASDSYDPDGVIANYFWDFGDGSNATGVVVVHSYADNGNYTVTLTITDDDGASSSVTATKTILNRAPVASFTESAETVYTGEIITFNASNSYDSDGVIVSYFWDFGDGANATGAVVSHFYVDDGSYTVTLTVTDDDGGVSTSTATKTVLNRLPVASFTENVETVYTNEAFMFNASASYDPDGIIVSYYWDFGDGTNATGAVVEHVYSNSGNYIVTLTVTDDDGATASATSVKTVLNRSPVAVFSWSPGYPILGEIVTFNASDSYDSDGLILSYEWNFGDGNVTTTSTPIITHVYANIGNYTVVLIITDDDGLSGTATNVLSVREYPTAVFTYSPEVPLVGQTVSFNASSSTPNGGTITNYEWNFGDGNITSTTSPLITHIYSTHGNLTVTLTVTDSEGLSGVISEIVTVEQPPIASFTYSPTSIIAGNVVTFNASESNDPGGYIVTYLWNFGDGNITTTTNPIITHVYPSHGSYTVSLTVTDNDGYTSTITKSFYVKEYPVASFTYSPSSPATGEIVTFDASSSQPKGGIIILYSWNFGDSSPLANTTTPTTTHIYTVAGNYTVTLTITDSERLSNSTSKALSISVKPVAIFTYSPGVPYVGGTVTFNASDSYDPDGYLVSYAWSFGDSSPPLSGNNSVVTHVYSAAGNYTVTLTVTDNEGFTKQTTKIVSVFKSPVASFYYYPKNPIWGEYITFNASASYDINGYIVRYYWDFGDGNVANVTTPVVTHMYAVDKTYTVTLTVTDNDGYRDQTSTTVKVRPPGHPVAYFTYSPSFPKVNEVVTFNASQSYDPNGNIGSYYWDFGDGSTKMVLYNPIVTHTYTSFGSYKVTLRVTDNQGNTDSVSLTLIVRANPEANFTWQPQTPLINQTITFDASSSKPNGGTIVSYTWDFGDGNITTTTSPSITHRYYSASDFAVTLTVKDSENLTDDAISTVRVQQPPVAEFTYSPQFPNAWETVTFNASSSYGFNSVIVQYRWDFGDGNITTTTSKIITHVYKAGGNLVVTLRVTDSNGLWSTKSKPIDIVGGPTAEFTWYPATAKPNQTVTFDASSSTLGWNGTHHPNIVSYAWDFGDGNITTTTNATIKHMYSQQGYYTVTLTITDDNGRQDNVTHTIQVSLTTLRGDITGPQGVPDGKVDIMDLALVSACFGSYPGHPKWDPRADVTGPGDAPDGKVDIMDVALVSSQFGMYV